MTAVLVVAGAFLAGVALGEARGYADRFTVEFWERRRDRKALRRGLDRIT